MEVLDQAGRRDRDQREIENKHTQVCLLIFLMIVIIFCDIRPEWTKTHVRIKTNFVR